MPVKLAFSSMDDYSTLHRSSCQDDDAAGDTAKEPRLSICHVADFIQAHRDELSRFIVRKLGTETEASDMLQDAFLRLSERQTEEVIDNPRAFVFRIIANLIVDFQRRSANRLPHETDETLYHALPENRPSPEARYQQQQRLEAINQALMELPEACRLAFYLNRVEGHSHADIAARLHISESMVAKHLARAMKHCRDRLNLKRAVEFAMQAPADNPAAAIGIP
jgi:RNA polymerase sigma factor (sigma-70 family)